MYLCYRSAIIHKDLISVSFRCNLFYIFAKTKYFAVLWFHNAVKTLIVWWHSHICNSNFWGGSVLLGQRYLFKKLFGSQFRIWSIWSFRNIDNMGHIDQNNPSETTLVSQLSSLPYFRTLKSASLEFTLFLMALFDSTC